MARENETKKDAKVIEETAAPAAPTRSDAKEREVARNQGEVAQRGDAEAADKIAKAVEKKQAELQAEVENDTYEATRDLVNEVSLQQAVDRHDVGPLSGEGTPMNEYEVAAFKFFKPMQEVEQAIDDRTEEILERQRSGERMVKPGYSGLSLSVNTLDSQAAGGEFTGGPVGSATVTTYPGEVIHPYPPTDYNHAAIAAGDLTANPEFAAFGLVAGDPFPPENSAEDVRETDGRIDSKDYMRVLRAPNDAIISSRRTNKYPTGTESPV